MSQLSRLLRLERERAAQPGAVIVELLNAAGEVTAVNGQWRWPGESAAAFVARTGWRPSLPGERVTVIRRAYA